MNTSTRWWREGWFWASVMIGCGLFSFFWLVFLSPPLPPSRDAFMRGCVGGEFFDDVRITRCTALYERYRQLVVSGWKVPA